MTHVRRRALARAAVLACAFAAVGEAAQSSSILLSLLPSLARLREADTPSRHRQIQVYAARGEYQSFQLVIEAPMEDLRDASVSVSEFREPGGGRIPRGNVTLYREHWVTVRKGSPDRRGPNRPLGAGRYPDLLIPLDDPDMVRRQQPFDIDQGGREIIWADIYVPRDAARGQYTADVSVRSANAPESTASVTLTVWGFELPLRPSLLSFFSFWNANTKENQIELLKNKLNPFRVNPKDERELIDKWGLAIANVGVWAGGDCNLKSAPPLAELQRRIALHQPDLPLYNFTADEIGRCGNAAAVLRDWGDRLHAAGIRSLATISPTRELLGEGNGPLPVDAFVVLPKMYDKSKDLIPEVLRRGGTIWSYNDLVQDDYSPKWLIDFAPANYRIQAGFLNQSLGISGLLYWRVDKWTADPWNDADSHTVGTATYPGEGMLVYPGEEAGLRHVLPSMRLKWLRDGVQDYEYVELLKKAGRGDFALSVIKPIATDWTNWTRDPAEIEAARIKLGTTLDEAQTQARPEVRSPRRSPH